eukprot:gene26827-33468_t
MKSSRQSQTKARSTLRRALALQQLEEDERNGFVAPMVVSQEEITGTSEWLDVSMRQMDEDYEELDDALAAVEEDPRYETDEERERARCTILDAFHILNDRPHMVGTFNLIEQRTSVQSELLFALCSMILGNLIASSPSLKLTCASSWFKFRGASKPSQSDQQS